MMRCDRGLRAEVRFVAASRGVISVSVQKVMPGATVRCCSAHRDQNSMRNFAWLQAACAPIARGAWPALALARLRHLRRTVHRHVALCGSAYEIGAAEQLQDAHGSGPQARRASFITAKLRIALSLSHRHGVGCWRSRRNLREIVGFWTYEIREASQTRSPRLTFPRRS